MDVKLIQTTDPFVYHEMFSTTSRINREFCRLNNVDYLGYIGLRVGCFPWHATFNRIPLLADEIRKGYRGWVLYLDADAYVAAPTFDIRHFLAENSGYSIIAAPGGVQQWCVNAGILLLNLGSEFARAVVAQWNQRFQEQVGDAALRRAERPWADGIKDDQVLLHEVLMREHLDGQLLVVPLQAIGAPSSTLIRQILRQQGTLPERQKRALVDINSILAVDGPHDPH